jgi:hypothetical protein
VASTGTYPRRGGKHPERFTLSPLTRSGSIAAVTFSLPHTDRVALKLYNLSGMEKYTLVDKTFNPGSYSFTLDARTIAPGNYLLRMRKGMVEEARSMSLFR